MTDKTDNRFGVHPHEGGTVVIMGLSAGRVLSQADALELVARVILATKVISIEDVEEACITLEAALGGPPVAAKALAPAPPPPPLVDPYARFRRARTARTPPADE